MKKPLILLLTFILFCVFSPSMDLAISSFFYNEGFIGLQNPISNIIYDYGPIPALIVATGSAIVYLLSFLVSRLKPYRSTALVLLLTLVIGAGVITNGLFKEYWGRPRPRQIIDFGGTHPFRPFYLPNFSSGEKLSSFCCGHATMGFYFFVFAVIGFAQKRRGWIIFGITTGILWGGALAITRISQGGHFFSDTVISALVMWMTAWTLNTQLNGEQYDSKAASRTPVR